MDGTSSTLYMVDGDAFSLQIALSGAPNEFTIVETSTVFSQPSLNIANVIYSQTFHSIVRDSLFPGLLQVTIKAHIQWLHVCDV